MSKEGFRAELEHLINRESRENGSNTPDWILADYLADCLAAFDKTVNVRETWYGRPVNLIGDIEEGGGWNCTSADGKVEVYGETREESIWHCGVAYGAAQEHERALVAEFQAGVLVHALTAYWVTCDGCVNKTCESQTKEILDRTPADWLRLTQEAMVRELDIREELIDPTKDRCGECKCTCGVHLKTCSHFEGCQDCGTKHAFKACKSGESQKEG